MSKALRLFAVALIGCILQTNIAQYFRVADITPDFMIAICVALTSFCGMSGSFCTSALMIMFYDASVGYVMALNPIAYILVALAASALRIILNAKLHKWKHKSVLIMVLICYFLALGREIAYVGYLFLIGAEFNSITPVRMLASAGYTSLITIPCVYLVRFLLTWHPFRKKHMQDDGDGE